MKNISILSKTVLFSLVLLQSITFAAIQVAEQLPLNIQYIKVDKAIPDGTEVVQLFQETLHIKRKDIGSIEVVHMKNDFYVFNEDKLNLVERYNVNKEMRGISTQEFKKILHETDGYFVVNKLADGKFTIDYQLRLRGGALIGARAGFYIGKGLTYGVCYGSIALVGKRTGDAGTVASTVANRFASRWVEPLSNYVGAGCGILCGIASGPY